MTFLETFRAILNDQDEIEGFPDPLTTLSLGNPTGIRLSEKLTRRLLRLQTIAYKEEHEVNDVPSASQFKSINSGLGCETLFSFSDVIEKHALVQMDAYSRCDMLKWQMVEIVREAVPVEINRFGVCYIVDAEHCILWNLFR